MVSPHFTHMTHQEILWTPEHPSRAKDPHYKYFEQARALLDKEGKLICWVCESKEHIELHHTLIEFSLATGVDIGKFEDAYPEFKAMIDGDVEKFMRFVEGVENLTPLCHDHHTGEHGIHRMPYPDWLPQKFWKADLPDPAKAIRVAALKLAV